MLTHECPSCRQPVEPVWDPWKGFGLSCSCKSIWSGLNGWTVDGPSEALLLERETVNSVSGAEIKDS